MTAQKIIRIKAFRITFKNYQEIINNELISRNLKYVFSCLENLRTVNIGRNMKS